MGHIQPVLQAELCSTCLYRAAIRRTVYTQKEELITARDTSTLKPIIVHIRYFTNSTEGLISHSFETV